MNKTRKTNTEQKPALVSPVIAAIASLIVPGLGQSLSRSFQKGLLLLMSTVSLVGLWVWRIRITARFESSFLNTVKKSFYLEPILVVVAIGIILIYLWNVYDAYSSAKRERSTTTFILWTLVLFTFFFMGWQISDIRPLTLVRDARSALPNLQRIMWPWDRAIARPEKLLVGIVDVQIPCVDPVPGLPEEVSGKPYISVSPTCGELSQESGVQGTTLKLSGHNFAPNALTEIWWQDDQGNEFRQRQAGEYITLTTDENGVFETDIIIPYRVIPSSDAQSFALWELQARQIASLGDPEPSQELLLSIEKMIETIFLGMMATFFGILLAVPVSFLAARNLMSSSWITLVIYYLTRAILNIIRSIEPLIWAVILVAVVGLGPFAGIIALTIHSIAALGKLYSEAIESIDPGPIEAIQATGANWMQTIMFAVVPQIIPPFVSFTIYRWDINVRMSTVLGLVGGGGIGFLLIQWMRLFDYKAAGIAIWFIAFTVAILDYVSSEIRARFV